MDFKVGLWYNDVYIDMTDYGSDYALGKGPSDLVALDIKTDQKLKYLIHLPTASMRPYEHPYEFLDPMLTFCVNIDGYIYTLGYETHCEFVNFRPLYSAVIENSKERSVDKHLELEFRITAIKEKGSNKFIKLPKPRKKTVFLKFLNGSVVSIT